VGVTADAVRHRQPHGLAVVADLDGGKVEGVSKTSSMRRPTRSASTW